ncbi:N-acetyltransferase [uncultured Vagococcus sp.]|uniref:GNAT family N-acetyltransferase n=1 Tax=uncultured Vagococcus sp. TaxID=189676 RepID=UPI0028D867D0|nr:N-acetyltransferase [uncultured Vagococcus sp.]
MEIKEVADAFSEEGLLIMVEAFRGKWQQMLKVGDDQTILRYLRSSQKNKERRFEVNQGQEIVGCFSLVAREYPLRQINEGKGLSLSESIRWRVGLSLLSSEPKAGELYISHLAVSNLARRHGYGQQILTHILNLGRNSGKSWVILHVAKGNQQAVKLYRRMGFSVVAEENYNLTSWILGEKNWLLMKCPIEPSKNTFL